MLGLEVKRSQLMIDDADLQPKWFGERPGRHSGVLTPAVPHDVVIPSFASIVSSRVQHAYFAHSDAHHVFVLRGDTGRDQELGRAKAGESKGTDLSSVRI